MGLWGGGHSAVVAGGGAGGNGGWGGDVEGRIGGEGQGGAGETRPVAKTGEGLSGVGSVTGNIAREVLHAHGLPTRFK